MLTLGFLLPSLTLGLLMSSLALDSFRRCLQSVLHGDTSGSAVGVLVDELIAESLAAHVCCADNDMIVLVVGIVMARHDVWALRNLVSTLRQFIKKVLDNGADLVPAIVRHRAQYCGLVRCEGNDYRIAPGLVIVCGSHPVAGLFLRRRCNIGEVGKQNPAVLVTVLRIAQAVGNVGRFSNSRVHFSAKFARAEAAGFTYRLSDKSGRGVSPCKGVFSGRSGSGVSDKNTSCRATRIPGAFSQLIA